MDISRPLVDVPVFDWVLCLEVGEHVPAKYGTTVLDNIAFHARRGVILSWARPGQLGHFHVNNRPNEWVIAQMGARGWAHDLETSRTVRRAASFGHFKGTLMVFVLQKEDGRRNEEITMKRIGGRLK